MTWLKVGDWVLNTDDISAVHYTETRDGPRVQVFTRSGHESYRNVGGFTAEGEEARRLWAWFLAQSCDVMSTPLESKPIAPHTVNGSAERGGNHDG